MRGMKQSLLLFAVLVFLVGCGKKEDAAAPQAQPKAKPNKAETAAPKEAANPWDTPTGLTLYMAQKIEDAEDAGTKAFALSKIALALAEAGDFKQAVEVAQKIENARFKTSALSDIASALAKAGDSNQAVEVAQKIENAKYKILALSNIAMTLATEPISENKKDDRAVHLMKKSFTPKEKQLAKQLVEAVQGV